VLRVLNETHKITFPVTKDLFGFYFLGPFMNGDTVRDSVNSSSSAFAQPSFGFMSRQELPEFLASLKRFIEPRVNSFVADRGKL
jgi:hypothetical protein